MLIADKAYAKQPTSSNRLTNVFIPNTFIYQSGLYIRRLGTIMNPTCVLGGFFGNCPFIEHIPFDLV